MKPSEIVKKILCLNRSPAEYTSEMAGLFRQKHSNGRNQLVGNFHYRLDCILESGFVFYHRFFLRLRFVMLEEMSDTSLIPSGRKSVLFFICFSFLCATNPEPSTANLPSVSAK